MCKPRRFIKGLFNVAKIIKIPFIQEVSGVHTPSFLDTDEFAGPKSFRSFRETGPWRHLWVEFVVGSPLCSQGFFSRYSGFPLSPKTNIFKFQFDPGMQRHFCTSSCKLLGAPWVNKLHIYIFTFYKYRFIYLFLFAFTRVTLLT